jgi:hypothetical protein
VSRSVVDEFLACLERGDMASCDVWSADAVLDATVPNWRFRKRGPAAIRAEYAAWFADPGHFEELSRLPVPSGEVVRYSLTWVDNGVPHAAHHMHLLVVEDGRITSDTVLCGGRWPASLLADMQAAQDADDARHAGDAHDLDHGDDGDSGDHGGGQPDGVATPDPPPSARRTGADVRA